MESVELRKSIRSIRLVKHIKSICEDECSTPTEYVMGLINQDIKQRELIKAIRANGTVSGISDTTIAQTLQLIFSEYLKTKR